MQAVGYAKNSYNSYTPDDGSRVIFASNSTDATVSINSSTCFYVNEDEYTDTVDKGSGGYNGQKIVTDFDIYFHILYTENIYT